MAETEHKTTDYKSTLKLPQTDFPMKANLPKREPEMLKHWDEIGLYDAPAGKRARTRQSWVLHDGPPYANGRVHLGHRAQQDSEGLRRALALDDGVPHAVRARMGLPRDADRVQGLARPRRSKARTMPKLELRKLCRAEAEKWIDLQRKDFHRLGCIGDWFNPYSRWSPRTTRPKSACCATWSSSGYVYRGLRPVHWCFD